MNTSEAINDTLFCGPGEATPEIRLISFFLRPFSCHCAERSPDFSGISNCADIRSRFCFVEFIPGLKDTVYWEVVECFAVLWQNELPSSDVQTRMFMWDGSYMCIVFGMRPGVWKENW